MFGWLHTKSATYKLITFAVFGLECIFGWRTGAMYQAALSEVIANSWEVWGLTVLFSVAVAVFGFALATHRQYGMEAISKRLQQLQLPDTSFPKHAIASERWLLRLAMVFFIIQDIAGVIYSFFGHGATPTFPLIAATVSMSGFTIVPFFTGHMTLALAESLPAEKRDQFYATLFDLWQDALVGAAAKWAKQARSADPAEILGPVIRGFMATNPDGLYADAMKDFFRMEGERLVPFRPQTTTITNNSTTSGADDDEEE